MSGMICVHLKGGNDKRMSCVCVWLKRGKRRPKVSSVTAKNVPVWMKEIHPIEETNHEISQRGFTHYTQRWMIRSLSICEWGLTVSVSAMELWRWANLIYVNGI